MTTSWKHGDFVERRTMEMQGMIIREKWKRAFFDFADEDGNVAITYPDGTKQMISKSQVSEELR